LKAAVFRAPGQIEVCEVAEPRPRAGEILIEVHACGLSGTDIQMYRSGAYRQSAGAVHVNADGLELLGHEGAGRVIGLGEGVTGWNIGDRVLALSAGGGLAERLIAPTGVGRIVLPPSLCFPSAVAAVPLAYALQMIRLAQPSPAEHLVVLGVGTVGLCLIELLSKRQPSFGKLIAVDIHADRLALARELGASHTVHALHEDVVAMAGRYCGWSYMPLQRRSVPVVAVVFDCAGHSSRLVVPSPLQQALALLAPEGGRVLSFAPYEGPIALDMIDLIHKQAHLIGSLGFAQEDLVDALALLAKGQVRHQRMTDCRMPLSQIAEAFEMQVSGDVLKVIVEPQLSALSAPPARS
jgi:threonine dehydrogenase-like Zn-dependent dehydrogenase